MFSQSTRLELTIVAAALLVLLLCRQPPKSGNAGVRMDVGQPVLQRAVPEGQVPRGAGQPMDDAGQRMEDGAASYPPSASRQPQFSVPQPPAVDLPPNATTSDNYTAAATQPKAKRIGMLDARRCPSLNYKDVLYGEVTVQRVWNGQKFVFRKVLEVKEQNGATSVWTFEERDDVIMSEIEQ